MEYSNILIGVVVGILIGWNVLPQPEAVKPLLKWAQEKFGMIFALFGMSAPKVPPPPTSNTNTTDSNQ